MFRLIDVNAKEFNDLMAHASRRMMIAALGVTASEADAADAVQEAMIRLWRKRTELAGADSPVAYAVATARRCALDIVRSRRAVGTIGETDASVSSFADTFENRDSLAYILRLIDALPSPQREVMTLRHLEGLEISEIQQQLNLSAGNIHVILSRGRAALRKYFEKI